MSATISSTGNVAAAVLLSSSSADDVAGVAAVRLRPRAASTTVVGDCERTGVDVLEAGGEVAGTDMENIPRAGAVLLALSIEVAEEPGRGNRRRELPVVAKVGRSVEGSRYTGADGARPLRAQPGKGREGADVVDLQAVRVPTQTPDPDETSAASSAQTWPSAP